MGDEDQHETWKKDGEVLAQIGRALFQQPTTIEVRLPFALAREASHARSRDDGDDDLLSETSDHRVTRHRAGFLALIGLAVDSTGVDKGDAMVV